jgi:indolepyruvate decarboxylase
MGEIICDTNFAVSETRIDMRKTIQALDGRVTMGYQVYPDLPLAALVDALLEKVGAGETAFEVEASGLSPRPGYADAKSIAPTDIAAAVNDLMAGTRQAADRLGHGRLPVHCDGDRAHRAGGARLLRHHGLSACRLASACRRRPGSGR